MSISADRACAAASEPMRLMTFGWVLKRALLGLTILAVTMGSVAWLTYASIDPALEDGQADATKVIHKVRATEVRL